MNTIVIPTAQNIELEYPQASLGDRMLAGLIDFLLLVGYLWLLAMLDVNFFDELLEFEIAFFLTLPVMFYSLLCEIFFNGRTLGKYVMKLQVINMSGASPDLSGYFIRWMLRIIDIWSVSFIFPGLVGIITIGVNKKGQRLGDIAAGTTVIKLKLVTTFGDTMFMHTGEDYQVRFPEIGNLSDRDVAILKEVLDAGMRSSNPDLLFRLASKVKEVAGIQTNMNTRKFLHTVLKDYNHLYGRK
ncbi:MAG: RDD family protein [Bacteroidota bacterium]